MTLALADVEGNGTVDLYIANNRADDIRDRGQVDLQMVKGQVVIPPAFKDRLLVVEGQLIEYGESDLLLLNDGKARFRAVSWTNGMFLDERGQTLRAPPRDWGLTATFRDINNDGSPDLYVCNDFWTPDRLWINDGHGRFRAMGSLAWRNMSASSMGVDFADIDRDGRLDFLVVDMLSRDSRMRKRQLLAQKPAVHSIGLNDDRPQFMRNTLYHGRGDGTFAEIANFAGLPASDWSWSPIFLDIDLDGFEDVLITAGHVEDVQDLDAEAQIKSRQRSYRGYTDPVERRKAFTHDKMLNERLYPKLNMPVVAFRNSGNLRFEDVTGRWGTDQTGVHHGMATGDFDNDGDLDFVVNNLGSPAGVYRNEANAPRVVVRLKGSPPNTQGVGANVTLLDGAVPRQRQEVVAGGRYLSGSDPLLVFAAGSRNGPMTLEITWRNGKKQVIKDVLQNRLYEIEEAGAEEPVNRESTPLNANSKTKIAGDSRPFASIGGPTYFRDVTPLLGHTHHEESFDDFARQALLPLKLSQLGPGVAWFDLDNDGHEDLIVGSGKGGRIGIFRGNGRGAFERLSTAPFDASVTRDVTAIVGWRDSEGNAAILAGAANYEDGLAAGGSVRRYDMTRKGVADAVPGDASSTGPIALGDLNGDGTLELFVGGRIVPGRYPEAADSRIYRYANGAWQLDSAISRDLKRVGLVSGAVWSDLTGDGFPELVLACDWGPVRIFRNEAGVLREATVESGLARFTGRWNGVSTGDLDGDGDLDIVAANWGLNSEDKATSDRPLFLCFGELAQPGSIDIIETEYDGFTGALAPRRMLAELTRTLPFLIERFPTHRAYSEASLRDVFRDETSVKR
ncbi:MAG TPA: VCBS repeat-containing protein, partial [Verrucomicrobiae bacterium]|nr:VCBS repeat-containing protein [Verrucomicrobiae bacterium]